jgi:hypothetical protein
MRSDNGKTQDVVFPYINKERPCPEKDTAFLVLVKSCSALKRSTSYAAVS